MKFGFEVTVENTYSVDVDVEDFLSYYEPELGPYLKRKELDIDLLKTDDMHFGDFLAYIMKDKDIDPIVGITKRTFIERNVEVW